ncbi:unnamed protein product [Penicillium salamii]|nr:unnamed protein product [Penicillium salamii]
MGLGFSDAVLINDVNNASSVYLNGINVFVDFNTIFFWGFVVTSNIKYFFCVWNYNTPQLFYLNHYYDTTIPSSCSKV